MAKRRRKKRKPSKRKRGKGYSKFLGGLNMDYRYIYLMERVSKKSMYSKLTFQHEVKIGIAKNEVARHKAVNRAIKGNIVIAMRIRLLHARRREQFLHRLFGASRFKIRGGRQGGTTEWFYLNWAEYLTVIFWLYWFKIKYYVFFAMAVYAAIWYYSKT